MNRTRKIAIKLLDGYQKWLSPVVPACCIYAPSCSEYAKQSIIKHGTAKGLLLGLARLARCGPWGRGGYDPVPGSTVSREER